jgi:predicted kinase
MTAALHFICGKAGAGKTTLARSLGASLPAVVFVEDEWFATLGFQIHTMDELRTAMTRCRAIIGPLAIRLLELGVNVVFDFGGNTVAHRAWVRGVFEAADADHALHVIEATDDQCLAGIHRRNDEQPAGVYFGHVSDEMFHMVTPYFVPPHPDEGFRVIAHARPA